MGQQYYNNVEFMKALNLLNSNPLLVKEKLEYYLEKFPKDYSAHAYYISVLITLGLFKEAEEANDILESLFYNNNRIKSDTEKFNIVKSNILYAKLRLYLYNKEYHKAFNLYLANKDYYTNVDDFVFFYIRKKLHMLDKNESEDYSYLYRQMISYNENELKDHLKKHISETVYEQCRDKLSVFEPNFPIEIVFEEIKKNIPSNKRIYPGFFENTYLFKYDECGRLSGKIRDYIKVVCFHDTPDIITICPCEKIENMEYIDLNYLNPNNKSLTKRPSQIEKFKNKYNR